MIGVKFDNIHSCNDLGVTLSAFSITPPEPKTYSVNIPGADGAIDLTSELGDIKYKNRILTLTFEVLGNSQYILNKYSDVMNAIHGRKFEKIVIEEDENYYYVGRVSVSALGTEPLKGIITVKCDVDPYKYDWGDDWLWDGFSFESGVINEMLDMEVSGTLDVTFIGQAKKYIPYITVSNDMTVVFKGNTYNLSKGKNKIFEIEFCEGENVLTFKGNGIVTVENKGGSL